jgi:Trk K+ transport system NAD-binding subunit
MFLSWVAPRGIVAAAVASLFAETLKNSPEFSQQAGYVESLTFLIIAGTVFFQGASARLVGKLLGVVEPDPNGIVIVGANIATRQLAKSLKAIGIEVLLIDSNNHLISIAKKEDLSAEVANAISPDEIEELEISGFGKLLAMTPNEKVNILACQLWSHEFGINNVFRVGAYDKDSDQLDVIGLSGEGHIVFPQQVNQDWLQRHLGSSWKIEQKEVKSVEQIQRVFQSFEDEEIFPLAIVRNKKVTFYEPKMEITEGGTLIFLEKASKQNELKNIKKKEAKQAKSITEKSN